MINFYRVKKFCFVLVTVFFIGCGSSSGETDGGSISPTTETIDIAKLIGTPFEGLTDGADLHEDFFLCGKYRTETIDSFPIKIFAAFFTPSQEAVIQEGIAIANEGMGSTSDGGVFYELTDTWSDDVRVIYKNNSLNADEGASGKAYSMYFTYNGKQEAEKEAPDWAIALSGLGDATNDGYTTAHELGHVSGIRSHALIDYENDTIVDFNDDNSIMDSPSGIDTGDYNFMMQMQGQIMEIHLGEAGNQVGGSGPSESSCEAEGLGE